MNKLIVIASVLVAASADPGYYGHQWQWPGTYGHGFSSTCYGCRGKRSAEPEPAYGVAHHPYGGTSYVGRTIWGFPGGHHYGKRSAEPEPYYGAGVAYHPYGGSSYVGRTVWGAWRGKRSAEAEPGYYGGHYGGHGYGGHYGGHGYGGHYGGHNGYHG